MPSPLRYHYFDAVVGLAWPDDSESSAGGSIATGRVFNAGQVKGDDPDKILYPCPPDWGLGVGLETPPHRKCVC
jgi:DNA-binding SARP family transcriptional activator